MQLTYIRLRTYYMYSKFEYEKFAKESVLLIGTVTMYVGTM